MEKLEDVLKERGSRYGDFIDNAYISNFIKKMIKSRTTFPDDIQGALASEYVDNLAQKLSRFLCEPIEYTDTLLDIKGYCTVYLKFATVEIVVELDKEAGTAEEDLFFSTVASAEAKAKAMTLRPIYSKFMAYLVNSIKNSETLAIMAKRIIEAIDELEETIELEIAIEGYMENKNV